MNRRFLKRLITLVVVIVALTVMPPGLVSEGTTLPSETQVADALGSAPLTFIENAGQFDPSTGPWSFGPVLVVQDKCPRTKGSGPRFQVRGGDRTVWLAEDAIWVRVLEQSDGVAAGPDRDTPPSRHASAPNPGEASTSSCPSSAPTGTPAPCLGLVRRGWGGRRPLDGGKDT